MVRSLDLIKLQLNQVQESLDILVRGKGCETLPGDIIPEDDFKLLPCKTVEDVEEVCKLLEDATKQKQLVKLSSDTTLKKYTKEYFLMTNAFYSRYLDYPLEVVVA